MASVKLGSKALRSIIKLKENGKLVEFYVDKHDYESGLNGPGRTLVTRKDCYDNRQWNSANINAYADSDIDTWLNSTYKNMLDPDIQADMGTTTFYYTPGNGNTSVGTISRSVFLLSATELGKTGTYLKQEGTALSSTVVNLLKIAYLNGSAAYQWTRSPSTDKTYGVWYSGPNGNLSVRNCSATYAARPSFTLSATLMVSDDGTVTTNTPPSTPAGITIPEVIQGGKAAAVSWSASSDSEGNLEGYEVQRSLDGGSTWTQIYQGGGTATSSTVPFGSETVMFRVRAYDSAGEYSGWRNSAQVTVVNNTAPSAPASITVPELVLGGAPLAVSWGASADSEGNLAGYELDRQVDGGDWTQVYKGPDTSFTDAITRGWSSVCYRVRAYDAYNAASGYTTAAAREVDNNRAPVITCQQENGADLGSKAEGFSIDYGASDADGDAVTVTEAVDGRPVRSFTLDGVGATMALMGLDFMKLLNGPHALTIAASDGKIESVHKLIFTKEVTKASVTLEAPMEADDQITICVLSVQGSIPADAEFKVEVTNNALDDTPVWEDCTVEVKNGGNHIFANQTAANGFAFNFRVSAERGESGAGGYINSVQGGFQ